MSARVKTKHRGPRRGKREPAEAWSLSRYFDESRKPSNGILLTLPILLLYEVGLICSSGRGRNAADALVERMLLAIGRPAALIVNLLVGAAFVWAAFRPGRRVATPIGLVLPVLAESLLYASLLAPLVSLVLAAAPAGRFAGFEGAVLALGAGFYEELVFRLAAIAGGFVVLRRLLRVDPIFALATPLILSSLAFAAFHHVGSGGEAFHPRVFVFRFLAGLALGLLFVGRGFGVACYTHLIYDLYCLSGT